MRIFKCHSCGNIIVLVKDGRGVVNCCDIDMQELIANSIEASSEKHVPVVTVNGTNVVVSCGLEPHPMEESHYIEFMIIETTRGYQIKYLKPGDNPVCEFTLEASEQLIAAYAYCNLHGLWINDRQA